MDLKVFRIAALQEGAFTVSQAVAAGLTPRMVRSRLERGSFVRVVRDVLSVPDWPDSLRRHLFIATLAVRRSAVSRGSAARLHAMPAIADSDPTVTVLKGTWRDLPDVRVHETRLLKPADVMVVDLLPVTTPARTLVDVAAEVGRARWAYLADRCLQAGLPQFEDFIACYASLSRRGRLGAATVTRYLFGREAPPVHELSEFEWKFEQLLIRAGLRVPVRQFRPPWYDGIRGVADYAIPEKQVIIELDGRSFHTTMQAFREDRRRDRLARQHGWTSLRYIYEEVCRREDEVITELRPLLAHSVGQLTAQ